MRFTWGLAAVAALSLGMLILPARAQPTGDEPKRQQSDREEQRLEDRLDEARLNVELLTLELQVERSQLQQQLQILKQYEFGFGGMGGMVMGGGFGGGVGPSGGPPVDREEAKKEHQKALASLREQYQEMKAATLETGRKLGRERRRLEELEGRQHAVTADGKAADDRAEPAIEQKGQGKFIQAGKIFINMSRIDYAEQTQNGLIQIHFSGSGSRALILGDESAKKFLEAIASGGR